MFICLKFFIHTAKVETYLKNEKSVIITCLNLTFSTFFICTAKVETYLQNEQTKAAVIIQKNWRRYDARSALKTQAKFVRKVKSAVIIQRAVCIKLLIKMSIGSQINTQVLLILFYLYQTWCSVSSQNARKTRLESKVSCHYSESGSYNVVLWHVNQFSK